MLSIGLRTHRQLLLAVSACSHLCDTGHHFIRHTACRPRHGWTKHKSCIAKQGPRHLHGRYQDAVMLRCALPGHGLQVPLDSASLAKRRTVGWIQDRKMAPDGFSSLRLPLCHHCPHYMPPRRVFYGTGLKHPLPKNEPVLCDLQSKPMYIVLQAHSLQDFEA